MEYSLLHGTGVRYSRGVLVCIGIALYGLWLIHLSWRSKVASWLRAFIPFCNVRTAQAIIGILMQLPLPGYLYIGFYTGMLG